jgi:hypothetical protein
MRVADCCASPRQVIPGGAEIFPAVIPAKAGIHFQGVAEQDGFPLSRE